MIPTTLYRIIIMALRRIWSSSHLTCRLLGKYTNRFVRSFSSGTDNNGVFELHKIPKTIIKRMNSLGVVTPTDIQRKVHKCLARIAANNTIMCFFSAFSLYWMKKEVNGAL